MSDRRAFLTQVGTLCAVAIDGRAPAGPTIDARATALYQHPEGRRNLVRITVSGVDAPAARARLLDRRGALVGTAGLLPGSQGSLAGELWVPLAEPTEFRVDVEVGHTRAAQQRVRLAPPRRWTVYILGTVAMPTLQGVPGSPGLKRAYDDLEAAVARAAIFPDARWMPQTTGEILAYLRTEPPSGGAALLDAIRADRVGLPALFSNTLMGLLDHETLTRTVLPAARLARAHGLTYTGAVATGVPGHPATLPLALVASGVRYMVSEVDAERALPLLPSGEAMRHGLAGDWTTYPQLYWWEGPDGSRLLHWRGYPSVDAQRLGFASGVGPASRGLSDWLLGDPVLLSPNWPYDVALLPALGADPDPATTDVMLATVEELGRRYAFPRLVPARVEDFFRHVEQRHGTIIPVRRGDTGTFREDQAASTTAALATFRQAQLVLRAADLLALWDARVEPPNARAAARIARRAAERRDLWRDLLLLAEPGWGGISDTAGGDGDVVAPDGDILRRAREAQAAARQQVADALLRIGRGTDSGRRRVVFNASGWDRTDVVRIPGGAGWALTFDGRELPSVDLPDGAALVVPHDVPGLGYLSISESPRAPRPLVDEGSALEAAAGGFTVQIHSATGALASLRGPDGRERVKPSAWSGLNQFVSVAGGAESALWIGPGRRHLDRVPDLSLAQTELVGSRRERLPDIGARLVVERRLGTRAKITSTITLYESLPWVDVENRFTTSAPGDDPEALYVAFPFTFTKPAVDVEIPLGRMRVERDQQPGSGRDWFVHTHWVWLTEADDGVLWSAPDTPLFTLNDVFRGVWRRRIEPDGTLFACVRHNYWRPRAPRTPSDAMARFRISLLPPGAGAEAARRGWAACDPLYVSEPVINSALGPLLTRDRALFLADPDVLVLSAKLADDGEGAIVKMLDVVGQTRSIAVWPAAWRYTAARRTNLVEHNEEELVVAADGRTAVPVRAWGVGAMRLFTP